MQGLEPAQEADGESVPDVPASGEDESPEEGDVEDDEDEEQDSYLAYLTSEYQRYRIMTLVFAVIGFGTVFLAIGLSQANIVDLKVFNLMMSIANLFIVMMLVLAFTRTRPFKKKIRAYDKYYISVIDHDAPDGVRIEQRALPDMDDFFKIFERQARTELIPETDEYKKLRKTWLAMFVAAGVALVASVALYLAVPAASIVAIVILLAAFVLVVVAFYFDRTRMRPLRTKWARDNYGMSEFQVRDRMGKKE